MIMKLDKQFIMMAFGFILLLGILIYNPFQIIVLQTQIKQQNDKIIENSDRNYKATLNGTIALFSKGNERGNETVKYFTKIINDINHTTIRLEHNDQIKFAKLNNLTKEIRNDTDHILQYQSKQSASRFQGERNFNLSKTVLEIVKQNNKILSYLNSTGQ